MIPPKESLRLTHPESLNLSETTAIDVRTSEAFVECHIEGALNFCVYEVSFASDVGTALPDKATSVLLYGESEHFHAASVAADRLQKAGYSNVSVLQGGLEAWVANAGGIVSSESPKSDPAGRYELDTEKSIIRWTGRNLTNQHDGTIACKNGFLEIGSNGSILVGELVADMKQMLCNDISDAKLSSLLIAHLESVDFFETEKYPTAQFSLDRIFLDSSARPGTPNSRIEGRMQIRGREQSLHLESTFVQTGSGYVLQTQFDLDRTAFGAAYGSARFFERLGMHLVNDLVNLQVTAFFNKIPE